jgi:hypothetical protein
MRCVILAAGLVSLSMAGSAALAQESGSVVAAATPATAAPPPAGPSAAVIPAGSPVIIELVDPVSSRSVKQGDFFPIRLAAPLVLDGRVIVPAGATGQGQVVDAGRAGALGKPAKLVLAARHLQVDGNRIDLRAFRLGAAGRDNSSAIMVASFVPYVGMLALFAKGGEIDVPAGTLGQAKLAADFPAPVAEPSLPPAAPAAAPSP